MSTPRERTDRGSPAPDADVVDVILRDGSTLRLHAPAADEAEALVAFFAGLSDDSRRRRFHGTVRPDRALAERFLAPDWDARGVLVGTLADGDGDRIVAVGDYGRLRDPDVAEAAFAVADDAQGKGIGTRLLEQLAARAGRAGIRRFVGRVLVDNPEMLRVFADAGFATSRRFAEGVIEVAFELDESAAYLERVDERDRVGSASSLAPLLSPASIAVVGASPRPGAIGGELFRNVIAGGFTGAVYPVNLRAEPVAGVRAYAAVADLPERVDLAVICVPADAVLAAAEEALAAGARVLCVISAGFAEVGREGDARQAQLLACVRARGARMVGPNCLGVASAGVRLNATFGRRPPLGGNIGFSSQSGALGLAVLEHAHERALGLSAFVSLGNKADVSSNDLLDYWERDAATDVILLYVESFGNPRRFARVASRVARSKPILAMKSGTSEGGARAAASHTAALAGSEAAVDALFEHAGVLRARTLEELLDAASLLAGQPLPAGNRVAIVTNAGGLGILCADAAEQAELQLAQLSGETRATIGAALPAEASVANPIDMLGSARPDDYCAAVEAVLRDDGVDAAIALFVPTAVSGAADVSRAIARAVRAPGVPGKPVLRVLIDADAVPPSGEASSSFRYPESAARALGLAARRAAWLRRPRGRVPELAGIDRATAREIIASALADREDVWLDAADSERLLRAYGIPLIAECRAATPADAVVAAAQLGYPVAVKSAVPGAHKTETGGVVVDLRDAVEVHDAAARLGGAVLVQAMARGPELLAGVVQDPVFGPLVGFGAGGALAELIDDVAFRLAPLTDVDALELIRHGAAGRLVEGFRGAAPVDVAALADLLYRLAALADDHRAVAELDLNPVMPGGDGVVAVDRRIRLRRPASPSAIKSW